MEGNPPPTDYAAMLADMEAKYSALGNAISSLRAVLATGVLGVLGEVPLSSASASSSPGASVSLPRGAFLGKTATDAIKLYLSAVRKKQTNKEIAQALKDGGLESTGSFDNYVTGGLFRLKNDGVVLRFDDGWGLAEWYPESFRSRAAEKAGNGGKRKTRKKAAGKAKKTVPDTKATAAPKEKTIGLEQQIMDLFAGKKDFVSSAEEIALVLNANQGAVSLTLGRLAAKRKLEKTGDGGYRAASGNVQEMPAAKAS